MNLDAPSLERAFVRGCVKKAEEHGIEKAAFVQFLLPLLGGAGLEMLVGRTITGPLLAAAGRAIAARKAAGLTGGFVTKGLQMLRGAARARIPGTPMRAHNLVSSTISFPVGMAATDAGMRAISGKPAEQPNDFYSDYSQPTI